MSPDKAALLESLLVERFTRFDPSPVAPVDAETAARNRRDLQIVVDEHRPLWLIHDATKRRSA